MRRLGQSKPNQELLFFFKVLRLACCILYGEIIKILFKLLSIWSNETKSNMEDIVLQKDLAFF